MTENAGQENGRQKCKAGKRRTKVQGWKMHYWKMKDKKYSGLKRTDKIKTYRM